MTTLREILLVVYPLALLAAGMVLVFYVGLIRGWWS